MITPGDGGVYIDLQVQPKARYPGVRGVHGDRLRVAVSEPPEMGKANEAVVKAVAGLLGVNRGAVSVVSGGASRQKRVFVEGVDLDRVRQQIEIAST